MTPDPQSQRFETPDGIQLHILRWSGGVSSNAEPDPPVILLHGGGANAHWWDHFAARIDGSGPVYALDFRGHGDSDHPSRHRVGAFNDDLEALVRWLGREDLVLIGHSMGAAVALDHASRFEATRALILIDLARGSSRGSRRRARLALSLRRTYRSREEAIDRYRFLPESSRASEALRQQIAEHSVRREPDGRFGYKFDPAWFGLASRPRPDLTRIHCPTLLVRGGESTLLDPDAAREFIAQIDRGRLLEIREAGHHVLLDQPERLLQGISTFLNEIDSPHNT